MKKARFAPLQRGFTLIELIAVLVILGIVASVTATHLGDDTALNKRGFYDQVLSALRHAQQTAISQQRFVCVAFTQNSISFSPIPSATCTLPLINSVSTLTPSCWRNEDNSCTAPAFTTTPALFVFDPSGSPDFTGSPREYSIVGFDRSVCLAAGSGYVYPKPVGQLSC